ncbi:S1 family peptidase [Streptomyces sp. NPDC059649]|uniref:S1 family peptidase n=1 Tax=Streptomyces sp. NPDC059649 TaxID=3346895 RepID=UPI003676D347
MLKHPRVPTPRSVLAGAGVVTLAIAPLLALQSAQAHTARAPGPPSAVVAAERAVVINSSLGAAGAGSYYDPDQHKLVVNVTTEEAAGKVRAAGAEARIVKHSLASLDAARATLKEHASIPGTSWAMDPKLNKVVVTADRTVRGEDLERLTSVAGSLGDRAVVQLSRDTLEPLIAGGDALWSSAARCSLGFNVTKDGQPYFLTAGHCARAVPSWSATEGGPPIAVSESGSFPGDDFGLARYTAAEPHPSEVDLYSGGAQHIVRAADPIVGQKVRRSGSTTHVHDGEVTALNVTANYHEGTVEGLIQTSICAESGDSGGPLFEGDTALGLTSGGRGACASGGVSMYQPVTEALAKTGSQVG